MFNFRIIESANGVDVIRRDLQTPDNSLTLWDFVEYTEMDKYMAFMDRMEKRRQREEENRRKHARNPLRKFACLCGIV